MVGYGAPLTTACKMEGAFTNIKAPSVSFSVTDFV